MRTMMDKLDANEVDAARLWAEIHVLREALKGPAGYVSWQDAAVAERRRRARLSETIKTMDGMSTRLNLSINSVAARLTGVSTHSPLPPLTTALQAAEELDNAITYLLTVIAELPGKTDA